MRFLLVNLVAVLAVSPSALADTNKCGELSARVMVPLPLQMDAPTNAELESVDHPKFQSARVITEDWHWDVSIWAAKKKEDLDLGKAKASAVASAKKEGAKLAWKASAKTADGYRLLYSTESKKGTVTYVTMVLRTVSKKKWLCTGVSEWAESYDCLEHACESVRANGG